MDRTVIYTDIRITNPPPAALWFACNGEPYPCVHYIWHSAASNGRLAGFVNHTHKLIYSTEQSSLYILYIFLQQDNPRQNSNKSLNSIINNLGGQQHTKTFAPLSNMCVCVHKRQARITGTQRTTDRTLFAMCGCFFMLLCWALPWHACFCSLQGMDGM